MIDDIHIIDDVVPKYQQDRIEKLMFDGRLPWMFFRDVAIPDDEINRLGLKKLTPGIGTGIIQKIPKYVNQQLFAETKILVTSACNKLNRSCKEDGITEVNCARFVKYILSLSYVKVVSITRGITIITNLGSI